MPFPFRRRDRNQFKHIAPGLIPAATVAPRSAVPRTPPPRSPKPSPERPRSALAAAILMTSLTGRTVAIPQPRQRSYSENDSTYVEESIRINPYATARDLGVEENWKEYAGRKNISSPVMSFNFEDEDTEEQMSEIEKEHVFYISERKNEHFSNEPIYATPLKDKMNTDMVNMKWPLLGSDSGMQELFWSTPSYKAPSSQKRYPEGATSCSQYRCSEKERSAHLETAEKNLQPVSVNESMTEISSQKVELESPVATSGPDSQEGCTQVIGISSEDELPSEDDDNEYEDVDCSCFYGDSCETDPLPSVEELIRAVLETLQLPKDPNKVRLFHKAVNSLLEKQVLVAVPVHEHSSSFYSNLSMVHKKDVTCHPILDLQCFSQYVVATCFKMESLHSVIMTMCPKEYLVFQDLQDSNSSLSDPPGKSTLPAFCFQFNILQGKAFLPEEKIQILLQDVSQTLEYSSTMIKDYMWVMGCLKSALEAFPYLQFHMREHQRGILSMIRKIRMDGALVILIVLYWPSMAWFADLASLSIQDPIWLSFQTRFVSPGSPVVRGRGESDFDGMAIEANILKQKGFLADRQCSVIPDIKVFLQGLAHAFPSFKIPTPPSDLNLVLCVLRRPPFESLASISLCQLILKMAFVLAVVSVLRVFLPKVVSEFHISQETVMPSFCQDPASSMKFSSLLGMVFLPEDMILASPDVSGPTLPIYEECRVDDHLESLSPRPDKECKRSPRRKQNSDVIKSGDSETSNQGPADACTDETEQLRMRNQYLTNENRELTSQLQKLTHQIKAMRVKLKDLKNERRDLNEAWKKQQSEADAAEMISLREQAQELVDENDALKMTVHRLNVELSRYQTKYRPLAKEENVKIGGLPQRGPPPPWLLDMKYLSPLLLAYEDRVIEKENLILSFEEEIKNVKTRVKKVLEENKQLHQQLQEKSDLTNTDWLLVQAQAKLVLEENQVLMGQLEVQQSKARETESLHNKEVSRLTKQIMVVEAKKQSQEEELLEIQKQLEVLRSKYDELKANMNGRIAAEEHVAMVNELKSQLQQERDKSRTEVKDLMDRISSLQAQKKSLLLEKNDLLSDNKILESEVETVKKSNRKFQKRVGQLKNQLEDAVEKEVAAHQYLANLISLTENIAGERDELIHVAGELKAENHGVLDKMIEGNIRLGRLEEMVKVYKKKTAGKLQGISHRLTEQEEDFAGKAAQYQREMKHLQWLLQDRQETLEEVLQQKRQVEGELEVIWKSTSHENKQMKAILHKAMKQNKWSTSNASQVYQHDSVNEYGFSYCDLNSSSHGEDLVK
ncbi:centrosomal protein of 89 kDa [Rhinophrynus dorsalis]